MITRSCQIQPVDMIGEDCERIPVGEVRELQIQFNVNHNDSEFLEVWLDEVEYHEMMQIVTDDEYFIDELDYA